MKYLSEDFVQKKIIEWLNKKGYSKYPDYKSLKEKGVDIKVMHYKNQNYFLVETKGQGKTPQINYNYFLNSLAQIITRMTVKSNNRRYAIGLPVVVANIAKRRLPYQIARKLKLWVLSVSSKGEVIKYTWQDLKLVQLKK